MRADWARGRARLPRRAGGHRRRRVLAVVQQAEAPGGAGRVRPDPRAVVLGRRSRRPARHRVPLVRHGPGPGLRERHGRLVAGPARAPGRLLVLDPEHGLQGPHHPVVLALLGGGGRRHGMAPGPASGAREPVHPVGRPRGHARHRVRVRRLQPILEREGRRPGVRLQAGGRTHDGVAPAGGWRRVLRGVRRQRARVLEAVAGRGDRHPPRGRKGVRGPRAQTGLERIWKGGIVIALIVVLVVVVLLVLGGVVSYNRFVSQRNTVRSSWANIDTELKRRYDLIPNLVETVKGYASHERETLEAV